MKDTKSRITKFVSVAPIATLIAASMLLSGCGGRDAHPVALTNPNDSVMDCAGISREFHANERQIKAVIHERTNAQGKNVALGQPVFSSFLRGFSWIRNRRKEWKSMHCAIVMACYRKSHAPKTVLLCSRN